MRVSLSLEEDARVYKAEEAEDEIHFWAFAILLLEEEKKGKIEEAEGY